MRRTLIVAALLLAGCSHDSTTVTVTPAVEGFATPEEACASVNAVPKEHGDVEDNGENVSFVNCIPANVTPIPNPMTGQMQYPGGSVAAQFRLNSDTGRWMQYHSCGRLNGTTVCN